MPATQNLHNPAGGGFLLPTHSGPLRSLGHESSRFSGPDICLVLAGQTDDAQVSLDIHAPNRYEAGEAPRLRWAMQEPLAHLSEAPWRWSRPLRFGSQPWGGHDGP